MREIPNRDLRTKAIVLKRTNYGETDRILNLLTPEGKISALAKGVRKEKSRLAGGIEIFCLSEVVLHKGKSDMATLTSASMLEFYRGILMDLDIMEIASDILKRASRAADLAGDGEYFSLVQQCLKALSDISSNDSSSTDVNADVDAAKNAKIELIQAWFYFNLAKNKGEQVNLLYDADGEKLKRDQQYTWDNTEAALRPAEKGMIGVNEIKMMRLMLTADLPLILRVAGAEEMAGEILYIAKAINQF